MELTGQRAKCLALLFLIGEFCVTIIYMTMAQFYTALLSVLSFGTSVVLHAFKVT